MGWGGVGWGGVGWGGVGWVRGGGGGVREHRRGAMSPWGICSEAGRQLGCQLSSYGGSTSTSVDYSRSGVDAQGLECWHEHLVPACCPIEATLLGFPSSVHFCRWRAVLVWTAHLLQFWQVRRGEVYATPGTRADWLAGRRLQTCAPCVPVSTVKILLVF